MHPSVNFTSTKDDPAIFANTEEELLPGGLLEDDFDEILIESIAVAEHNQPSVEKNGFLDDKCDKEVAAVTKNLQSVNLAEQTSAVGQVSSKHLGQVQHYRKIRRPPALFAKETDENVLARRTKDIQKGYNCEAYKYYLNAVPKDARIKGVHPVTPTKELKFSRRSWDAQVRLWRKNIHTAVHHEVIDEQPNFDEEKSSDFYGGKLTCKENN
ncbi:Oocyte-specific histone RNA stem-loop-binding protein 2 [Trichinella nelsoni]|uniref:Oocyte-specific histone RNA stem-loop-binding protein 2 n=1 Tax=Trichinella nelsoni TaxID=6336 RepID=A0A0V0S0W2_9BILA|nr:Oocyte-specific histone RNA stem-loop-binding protein 2 [Trichinella nelsoni]